MKYKWFPFVVVSVDILCFPPALSFTDASFYCSSLLCPSCVGYDPLQASNLAPYIFGGN